MSVKVIHLDSWKNVVNAGVKQVSKKACPRSDAKIRVNTSVDKQPLTVQWHMGCRES